MHKRLEKESKFVNTLFFMKFMQIREKHIYYKIVENNN
jgi:hypothetical protein